MITVVHGAGHLKTLNAKTTGCVQNDKIRPKKSKKMFRDFSGIFERL